MFAKKIDSKRNLPTSKKNMHHGLPMVNPDAATDNTGEPGAAEGSSSEKKQSATRSGSAAQESKKTLSSSSSEARSADTSTRKTSNSAKKKASQKRTRALSADSKSRAEKNRAASAENVGSDKISGSDRRVKTGLGLVSTAKPSEVKAYKIKLLMLGDSGVGKTCLMRRYADGTFNEHVLSTAGVDFAVKTITAGNKRIAVQIWDTAGQERFHKITRTYYKGANGIVLVFDVTKKATFNNIGYWMKNIQESLEGKDKKDLPAVILVGNKVDLPGRVISREQASAEAAKFGVTFYETSAKQGLNVTAAMNGCATHALDKKLGVGVGANFDGNAEKKKGCIIS